MGTVPFDDAAAIDGGFLANNTSRNSTDKPE
jgi:hypothetical protein